MTTGETDWGEWVRDYNTPLNSLMCGFRERYESPDPPNTSEDCDKYDYAGVTQFEARWCD